MELLKIALLLFAFETSKAQSVSKCPDFKPVEDVNFKEILKGRWHLVRFYGFPTVSDSQKASCPIFNDYPTDVENEITIEFLITPKNEEIKNETTLGKMISPGIMEINQTKEFEHAGIKMKVNVHAMHYLLYSEGGKILVGGCSDHMANKNEFFMTGVVLSRETTVTPEFIEKSEEIISSYNMATTFTEFEFDDCKY